MPLAPPRPCPHKGCGRLHCTEHSGTKPWNQPEAPRVRGRELQRRRTRLFQRSPLCVLCLAKGITRAATIRDHVVPLAEGGSDDETNEQAICLECHAFKTQQESQRGRLRMRPW